ncbi:hypothetical protein AAFN46_15765 [Pseudomonas sp. CAU 1711]|uniref:hypothetical protein n=1 Tax=Pseudomonas sp. CAU 1711 TaxID=3140356 RepID=UPI0032615741
MTRSIKTLCLVLTLVGVAACSRQQPVLTIHQQVPPHATALNEQTLRPALIRALVRCKWSVEQEEANRILARIDFRGHSASITLDYVADRYDIRYRDSHDLDYENGKIHKRYNALVKKLNRAIQQEVRIAQNLNTQPLQ